MNCIPHALQFDEPVDAIVLFLCVRLFFLGLLRQGLDRRIDMRGVPSSDPSRVEGSILPNPVRNVDSTHQDFCRIVILDR